MEARKDRHSGPGHALGFQRKAYEFSLLALCLLVLVFSAPTAAASQPPTLSVREALQDENRDRVPDRLGETVTLVGVFTSDPVAVRKDTSLVNFQDATGGIVLFAPRTVLVASGARRGDMVEIRGKLSQYRGMEEILVEEMRRLGGGPVPQPRDVSASDLADERYSGQLVRLKGRLEVSADFLVRKTALLRDRTGEIPVLLATRLFTHSDFVRQLTKGGKVELVGIASQYDETPPFDSGYRFVPRDPEDFTFVPVSPYLAIALLITLLTSLVLAGYLYLWTRRRHAERRVREMTALITERKRAEEALRNSEERHRLLFQSNPHPMWVYDLDALTFLAVNDAAVQQYGHTKDEFLSLTIKDIRPPEEIPALLERIPKFTTAVGVRHRRKDGTIIDVETTSNPWMFGERRAKLVVATDVSERKKLEEQLRQAQKMEAVGRLAGGVAHDFNNLLTVISGYTDLLLSRLPENEAMRKPLGEVKKAADRAASLTSQLLAFSRKQILEPKVLDLNTIVTDTDKLLRRLIGEDIDLVTVLAPNLGSAKADPGQVEQVILNLAVNARDAMPKGGKLTIETANVQLDEAYARTHDSVRPGPHVMLAVSDNGCGMDAETQAHIFEPFFTTKEMGKGTGLGLATVYGIVKQSGGNIWVYSEPGQGTTFKIYLPRVQEQAEFRPSGEPPTLTVGGSEIVLLVEDDETVRALVRESLESNGYTILEASHGAEAVRICEQHQGLIHLMVTDVVMPEMSGRELAERVAQRRPEMKVLYLSGYTSNAIVHHGVLDRCTAFLQKPFTPVALAQKVREVLDAHGASDRIQG